MLLRDRPLIVDGVDASLYVERSALEERVLTPIREGRNVLILGESGAGKSTLLRKVVAQLKREGRHAVLVNGSLASDAAEFLELVEIALEEHLVGASHPPPRRDESHLARLVHTTRRLQHDQAVAILVDGPIASELAYDLFGRLRDELWSTGHSWTVAVRPTESATLRAPPADAFWARVVSIPPLDRDETSRLLEVGLTAEEHRLIDQRYPSDGVYPRHLIRWVKDALERGEVDEGGVSPWFRAYEDLGRSDTMALNELHGLGRPVSAHDEEFLARMRWSRPYAQRILSRLEARGLLQSLPERTDQPGRPRKLYELVDPSAH